jgi:hypothetical protein
MKWSTDPKKVRVVYIKFRRVSCLWLVPCARRFGTDASFLLSWFIIIISILLFHQKLLFISGDFDTLTNRNTRFSQYFGRYVNDRLSLRPVQSNRSDPSTIPGGVLPIPLSNLGNKPLPFHPHRFHPLSLWFEVPPIFEIIFQLAYSHCPSNSHYSLRNSHSPSSGREIEEKIEINRVGRGENPGKPLILDPGSTLDKNYSVWRVEHERDTKALENNQKETFPRNRNRQFEWSLGSKSVASSLWTVQISLNFKYNPGADFFLWSLATVHPAHPHDSRSMTWPKQLM